MHTLLIPEGNQRLILLQGEDIFIEPLFGRLGGDRS
jgi:hypothetical protein